MTIEIDTSRHLTPHEVDYLNGLVHTTGECYSLNIQLLDLSTDDDPLYKIDIKEGGSQYIEKELQELGEMLDVLNSDIKKAVKDYQSLTLYFLSY